jgi:Asp-tRNA(Asn)/Glu-tRNA(Gln) amidotransferase A subunit family amidase
MAWLLGQGPLAHTTAQLRLLLDVARPTLQKRPARPFKLRGVMLYAAEPPGRWPTFPSDIGPALGRAFAEVSTAHGLPTTAKVGQLYGALWASHLDDLLQADPSLSFWPGLRAVLSAVVFRGAFGDRRFHPRTAELLAAIVVGRYTLFRHRAPVLAEALALRDRTRELWDRGYLLAAPVCCYPPPFIGRSNYNRHLIDCTVLGNLADATGLAIPFGRIDGLPRAVQLLGPPGSEGLLVDLADAMTPKAVG